MGGDTKPRNAAGYQFYDENYKGIWKRGISRKIGESAFVQQTLPTHRLSWSPLKVCPALLLMGGLFIGMGIGIKYLAHSIKEVKISYTNCTSMERPSLTCYQILENATNSVQNSSGKFKDLPIFNTDANDIENCSCTVPFELKEPLNGAVYMYYSLTNFLQNHLRFYPSRDENQLKGDLFDKNGDPKEPSIACKPLNRDEKDRVIYPCGVFANSMFTDVIDVSYHPSSLPPGQRALLQGAIILGKGSGMVEDIDDDGNLYEVYWNPEGNEHSNPRRFQKPLNLSVPLIRTGIAWESDRMDKYGYPDEFFNARNPVWTNFTKPYGWKRSLWQLDPNNMTNNGVLNEDFIVWMRAAAFPWFRKLYRIVDRQVSPFENGLPAGKYTLRIQYNYDVSSFNGEKEIIFTTSDMVAGKNMFLAIVYISTGGLCIFLSIFLFIVYKFFGISKSKLTIDDIKKD